MCGERERGYAGKVEDIKRKTKNANPEFFFFFFFFWGGGVICYNYSSRYFTGLPRYGLHKNSLKNY